MPCDGMTISVLLDYGQNVHVSTLFGMGEVYLAHGQYEGHFPFGEYGNISYIFQVPCQLHSLILFSHIRQYFCLRQLSSCKSFFLYNLEGGCIYPSPPLPVFMTSTVVYILHEGCFSWQNSELSDYCILVIYCELFCQETLNISHQGNWPETEYPGPKNQTEALKSEPQFTTPWNIWSNAPKAIKWSSMATFLIQKGINLITSLPIRRDWGWWVGFPVEFIPTC